MKPLSDLNLDQKPRQSSSYKDKVLVLSAKDFQFNLTSFTDFYHIWRSGLSHIPCSHSRPLTHSQKEDNAFCTCPDFVYAFSCDLKVPDLSEVLEVLWIKDSVQK